MMDVESYHFFGNLHLPPPEDWLPPSSLQNLRDLEPYIADLELRQRRGGELQNFHDRQSPSLLLKTDDAFRCI